MSNPDLTPAPGENFLRRIVTEDLSTGRVSKVVTRFPPEPNGYLHLGHAQAIWLDFGTAAELGGRCILRYDDTNPNNAKDEYIEAILEDTRWLGYEPSQITHASDYFEPLHNFAVHLIERGLAYVDEQSGEALRAGRGTLTEPGQNSPYRDRDIAENLAQFARMKAGEFADGGAVLRAKIDMRAGNLNLRDPVLYRVLHAPHPRTGSNWCIYPLYDFAHGLCDALEGVTHSFCTLEFEDHRPLYDWLLAECGIDEQTRPHQYEFARLNVSHTVTSKRRLAHLVESGLVDGWDDPRLPTLRALRRRGCPPAALREFVALAGITKKTGLIDLALLENCQRRQLEAAAPRAMAVINPLKLTLINHTDTPTELSVPNHPQNPDLGTRPLQFGRELYIERDDFASTPPPGFRRLHPGGRVRLRYAYVVRCVEVVTDANGEVVEVLCEYDPDTAQGKPPEGPKVRGIIHWVCAASAQDSEVRLYDRLFTEAEPDFDASEDLQTQINPDSLATCQAKIEAGLSDAQAQGPWQFERLGYFSADPAGKPGQLIFNRVVALRDTWGKRGNQ